MKTLSFAIALLFMLSACVSPPSTATRADPEGAVRAEVQAAFDGLVAATKAVDTAAYFSFFDQSLFTALNADGSTLPSFEAFERLYGPQIGAIERYNSLVFDPVIINVIDANTAVLVNEFEADIVLPSGEAITARGSGVQVWSKRTGTWKLVHVSSAAK